MNSFEQGNLRSSIETVPPTNPRAESIKEAAKNVVEAFKVKLSEVLDRIGENPYFRDLEQTI